MKVLIAHARLKSNGGAEVVAHAFIKAFKECENEVGVIDIDGHETPDGVRQRVPFSRLVHRRFGLITWAVVCRHVLKISPHYDAVVYMYGEGPSTTKPTIVFRHAPVVFARSRLLVEALAGQSGPTFFIRKLYGIFAAKIAKLGSPDTNVFNVANSKWTAGHVESEENLNVSKVLYPATHLTGKIDNSTLAYAQSKKVIVLGRIVPNKRVDEIISIAECAKQHIPNLSVDIVGRTSSRYAQKLIKKNMSKSWIKFHANATDSQRNSVLQNSVVGIHAYRAEHFGIAVAEMIHANVLPIVYNAGGVCELVPFRDQRFDSNEEMLSRVLEWLRRSPTERQSRLELLRKSPAYVSGCNFDENLTNLINEFQTTLCIAE